MIKSFNWVSNCPTETFHVAKELYLLSCFFFSHHRTIRVPLYHSQYHISRNPSSSIHMLLHCNRLTSRLRLVTHMGSASHSNYCVTEMCMLLLLMFLVSLFYGTVNIPRLYSITQKDGCWIMNWKGSGRKQPWSNQSTIVAFPWKEQRKSWKISVMTATVPDEIQTKYPLLQ
jgi:hypothetical protein